MMEISGIYKRIYDLSFKMGENKNLYESYKSMQTLMKIGDMQNYIVF